MALPYTIVLTVVGLASVYFGLLESTEWLYQQKLNRTAQLLDKGSSGNH